MTGGNGPIYVFLGNTGLIAQGAAHLFRGGVIVGAGGHAKAGRYLSRLNKTPLLVSDPISMPKYQLIYIPIEFN